MDKFMRVAIDEAKYGIKHNHGGPFGCVIVRGDRIVSKAHNEVLRGKDATNHAEILAIHRASKKLRDFDLSDCELYVTGRPCPMCRMAIQWAKISKVYYGCDYEDAKEIGFNEENGNSSRYVEEQIESDSCKLVYDEYNSSPRTKY